MLASSGNYSRAPIPLPRYIRTIAIVASYELLPSLFPSLSAL